MNWCRYRCSPDVLTNETHKVRSAVGLLESSLDVMACHFAAPRESLVARDPVVAETEHGDEEAYLDEVGGQSLAVQCHSSGSVMRSTAKDDVIDNVHSGVRTTPKVASINITERRDRPPLWSVEQMEARHDERSQRRP